jgi:hypothetical protein
MNVLKTAAAGTIVGGSLLFTIGLGLAGAQPDTANDGQVNVSIGNVGVLEDVAVASAAELAAAVCDLEVGPVNEQVTTVDADGVEQTVCTNNLGAIVVQQNGPGQSENAPGQQPAETPTSTTESPTEEAPAEPGS